MPYHTHVDPGVVVAGLNRLIDDAASGRTVFYRFYSNAQTQQEPAKGKTGLFFFRGQPGAPFAVIAPGGGFSYVASVHEGFPYAVAINSRGYNAFVLRYRAGQGGTVATEDMAAAISYILDNAASFGVGSPATHCGAVRLARGWPPRSVRMAWRATGGVNTPKPSAVVMACTGHSEYGSDRAPDVCRGG